MARELALDIADAEFGPDVCNHLPGLANGVADVLSRRFQPGKEYEVPAILKEAVGRTRKARYVPGG